MSDLIIITLPDGRWLAFNRGVFQAALAAGAEFAGPPQTASSKTVNELLTSEQVAERLKLPQSWIEEATRQGRLPCHEFGRYRRYSLTAVLEAARQERRDVLDHER
jgi:excisionase family DNA binding protein